MIQKRSRSEGRELIHSWKKKDFKIETFRCGGKGGQRKDKTNTGVRITHLESGLVSESREHSYQRANRNNAFRKLAEKIVEHYKIEDQREQYRNDERIRTYHRVRNTVTDHRSGKSYDFDSVLDAKILDKVIRDVILSKEGD